MNIFDATVCQLGEGPLWHPELAQFFWFDIIGQKLLTKTAKGIKSWDFDEATTAAGWVDRDTLMVVSETGFYRLDLASGTRTLLAGLEANDKTTRSNDGRADPWGGFWIGTMGKEAETGAGSIYRYFEGKVTRMIDNLSIPNSICFSPDRAFAYYADTFEHAIRRQALDNQGWPKGDSEILIDLRDQGLNPDGSVVDATGAIWNAQWGAGRVARYDASGKFLSAVDLAAAQTTCPAFGGENGKTMIVTSAATGIDQGEIEPSCAGQTFLIETGIVGQAEYQVRL